MTPRPTPKSADGMLTDRNVVITGGTGSLGKVLVRRLLSGELGRPRQVVVFSRDEAKQHAMRLAFQQLGSATDEVIYGDWDQILRFRIGDVRDFHSVVGVLRNAHFVFNAAALKQVPACEYFPYEAVSTNITGAENIVRAIRENSLEIDTVVGVSTDKACKPVNVMGMTKAIQERVFIRANMDCPDTRFICVRYGNVLASRGSVIPLFHHQIRSGGPVTITTADMTRFLLSLDQAVDTIFAGLDGGARGDLYVPRVPSAKIIDVARALIGDRPIETRTIGIRPGEKVHEILISEEETHRAVERGDYYVILPMLPELRRMDQAEVHLDKEYSSADATLTGPDVIDLLRAHHLMLDDSPTFD